MTFLATLLAVAGLSIATTSDGCHTPPACSAVESHQFDFWIGDWNVVDPHGKVVGHNRIESILGGCALAEHWDSASGIHGVSYNAYDTDARKRGGSSGSTHTAVCCNSKAHSAAKENDPAFDATRRACRPHHLDAECRRHRAPALGIVRRQRLKLEARVRRAL